MYKQVTGEILDFLSSNIVVHTIVENGDYCMICIPSPNKIKIIVADFLNLDLVQSIQKMKDDSEEKMVLLAADYWQSKQTLVESKLLTLSGKNATIHGRDCHVGKVSKPICEAFMVENHLLGSVNAEYFFGIFHRSTLIGCASFAKPKHMIYENPPYMSIEMVRFATIKNITVTGGLGKIIHYMKKEKIADEIMTYIDRDWSEGESFEKVGFVKKGELPPMYFWFDTVEKARISPALLQKYLNRNRVKFDENRFYKVWNSGSIKLSLPFHD